MFVEVPAVEVSTTLTVQSISIGSSDLDSSRTHPCFLLAAQPAPHPRGHTPISQNGSIAPVYILLWTNG